MKIKDFFKKSWLFVLILLCLFIFLFAISFSFVAYDVVSYNVQNFFKNLNKELKRPLNLKYVKEIKEGVYDPVSDYENIVEEKTKGEGFTVVVRRVDGEDVFVDKYDKPELIQEAFDKNMIELPGFNIVAPIHETTEVDEKVIYKNLREGVVLYPGSDDPGFGYSLILGHSASYSWEPGKYKTVFSLLYKFKEGDLFYIYWNQIPLVFEVQGREIFSPDEKNVYDVFPYDDEEKVVILQTCWPLGIAYQRLAIKGVLVK